MPAQPKTKVGRSAVLDRQVDGTVRKGHFAEAAQLLDRRAGLNPPLPYPEERMIRRCGEHLSRSAITDEVSGRYLELASQVLREAQADLLKLDVGMVADEEAEWLSGRLHVQAGVEEVMQLNEALADAVAESDLPEELTSHITLMFVPAPADGDHAA